MWNWEAEEPEINMKAASAIFTRTSEPDVRSVVTNEGQCFYSHPGDSWQCLETLLVVTPGGKLLASSG